MRHLRGPVEVEGSCCRYNMDDKRNQEYEVGWDKQHQNKAEYYYGCVI